MNLKKEYDVKQQNKRPSLYFNYYEEALLTEITLKKKGNVKVESKAYKGKHKAKIFINLEDPDLEAI